MQIPWEPREGSLFWLDWTGKCSLPSLLDDQPTVVQSSISEAIKTATFPVCPSVFQSEQTKGFHRIILAERGKFSMS